jgi:hypothetical protein
MTVDASCSIGAAHVARRFITNKASSVACLTLVACCNASLALERLCKLPRLIQLCDDVGASEQLAPDIAEDHKSVLHNLD